MYLEAQTEQRKNWIPTLFASAMIVPALLFWAWTEVRGSTPVTFKEAVETRELAQSVSPTCRQQARINRYYFDCFDQVSLFENAASEALLAEKPLMVIFGREQCGDCEKLEQQLSVGPSASNFATANAYREVATSVLQVRLVRYRSGAKEIARELGAESAAEKERDRLYAPFVMFYDPASGSTSYVKWSDHDGLDLDRLGIALLDRLKQL